MKNFSLFFSLVLFLTSSCSSSAQKEKQSDSYQHQVKRIDIDVSEFKDKMKEENVVVLDVRTPLETVQGKIEGAIEIDIRSNDFKEKIQELDKSKTYLVYCRSGRRSVAACDIMEKEGFESIYNLLGGYLVYSK